jgi:hypothetical protein
MAQLSSRFLVTLTVAGRSIGRFQTHTGAGIGGDAMSTRPPGAEFPRQQGGEKTLNPITIGRDYDPAIDTDEILAFLRANAHVENAATVGRKRLDANRNPAGKGSTWIGVITAVNDPESDTNAQNDKAQLTIVIQPSSVS